MNIRNRSWLVTPSPLPGRIGRIRCALSACAALLFLACSSGVVLRAQEGKPNIIFLYADDLSYDALHVSGNPDVQTPNLDRLAQQGTTFTHCFNMGGWHGAVCVASRTMLLTGRAIWHAHELEDSLEVERDAGRFWSEQLRTAGYRTYFTGKWHVKTEVASAFDVVGHYRPGGMPKDSKRAYNRPLDGQPDIWSPLDPDEGGYWEGGKHWSEVTADDALSFLDDAKTRPSPFFIYAAFNAPHDPRQAPQSFLDGYPVDQIHVPANFLSEYPHHDVMGCTKDLRDEALGPFPRTEHAVRVHRREYYAIISHLDEQIGRIIDALDATGQRDKTWIVFTADNGLALGHHGLFGKQSMYDHSVRIPFIIAGPQAQQGRRIDTPIYLQDVMPTTLELAHVEKPEYVYFESLLPLLNGTSETRERPIYGAYYPNLQRMIRNHGYKLILYPQWPIARLYHVADDPGEQQDVIGTPGALSIARRLFAELLELQRNVGDTLDLAATYPELAAQAQGE